jgi:hypothetical protein
MWAHISKINSVRNAKLIAAVVVLVSLGSSQHVHAITPLPTPPPQSGSYGLEATKTQPPPTTGATISTPGSGSTFTTNPITVSGICPDGLLVQIYDNGVMVGAVDCKGGSFSLQISLFSGQNDLSASVFDDLDQKGPDSNHQTVNFNNASTTAFGALITLTSNYGRRGADPGKTLTWPLLLSGGAGPYAFSIDWGDGGKPELKSQALAGEVDIAHVYKQSGIYHVTVRVTDANGTSAFLQVVAIGNGTAKNTATSSSKDKTVATVTKILWLPAVICLLLLIPAYWLGRRSELFSLNKALQKDMTEATRKEGPTPIPEDAKDAPNPEAVEKSGEGDKKA